LCRPPGTKLELSALEIENVQPAEAVLVGADDERERRIEWMHPDRRVIGETRRVVCPKRAIVTSPIFGKGPTIVLETRQLQARTFRPVRVRHPQVPAAHEQQQYDGNADAPDQCRLSRNGIRIDFDR
jgi:hypothetical protein